MIRLVIILSLFLVVSCKREYSYERVPINIDTIAVTINPVPELPPCIACNNYTDPIGLNQWSLKAEQSKACGIIDTAIATFDRAAFTFFGASSCSIDTGLVMTVYLENVKLDKDLSNVYVPKVSFFYYDRVAPTYIFISSARYPFSVYIDKYEHQTKTVTGRFDGFAKRTNGVNAFISQGHFKVKVL